jgi:sorting nexin-9/18/33
VLPVSCNIVRSRDAQYTSEFVRSPGPEQKRLSNGSLTPRGSPEHKPHELAPPAAPLIPQTTGEWLRALPSFRRSLLGGKAFNRFSSFVTSGAEAFVLSGADVEPLRGPSHARGHSREATNASIDAPLGPSVGGESDQHFVDAGPSWRQKVPPFRVLVHSPTKQRGALAQDYIMYGVTSLFHPDTLEDAAAADRGHAREGSASSTGTMQHAALARLTVHRRFSHFVALHAALLRRLPGLALPPLPEKQYAGRFSNDFVEARRGELERYLARLVRHPVVRYAEVLTFFLSCESDAVGSRSPGIRRYALTRVQDWKKYLPEHLTLPPAGPAFYARVYHPEFNVDHEDAAHAVDRFEAHTKAVGRGVQDLRGVFGRMREARVGLLRLAYLR